MIPTPDALTRRENRAKEKMPLTILHFRASGQPVRRFGRLRMDSQGTTPDQQQRQTPPNPDFSRDNAGEKVKKGQGYNRGPVPRRIRAEEGLMLAISAAKHICYTPSGKGSCLAHVDSSGRLCSAQ